jgi:hypothetical protein
MPVSTDILLPLSHTPSWPDECIRCGTPRPGAHFLLSINKEHPVLPWARRTGRAEPVPVCAFCVRPLTFNRTLRYALFYGGLVAGVAVGFTLAHTGVVSFTRATKWMSIICGILGAAPGLIYNIFFPMTIDAEMKNDTIRYEFANSRNAADFARLNTIARADATPT